MKPGLMLPYTTNLPLVDTNKKLLPGDIKRLQLFTENNKQMKLILDKWKQSGHTVRSGEDLINCIKGR